MLAAWFGVFQNLIALAQKISAKIFIVTSASFAISNKSIFTRTVIGSLGIVTHSIIITAVCPVGALVYF